MPKRKKEVRDHKEVKRIKLSELYIGEDNVLKNSSNIDRAIKEILTCSKALDIDKIDFDESIKSLVEKGDISMLVKMLVFEYIVDNNKLPLESKLTQQDILEYARADIEGNFVDSNKEFGRKLDLFLSQEDCKEGDALDVIIKSEFKKQLDFSQEKENNNQSTPSTSTTASNSKPLYPKSESKEVG